MPIAKRMRSGAERSEFVRPVKWLVLLKDEQVIAATIQGLSSGQTNGQGFETGRYSVGHRFHHPEPVAIEHAESYEQNLSAAHVIADFDQRQQQIIAQVQKLADEVGATAIVPQDLLDEVTALVDYPVALRASFEPRFLQVPQEALISTIQADQKVFFCLTDANGKLQPYFIFISNIDSKDKAQVIAGNEKVVRHGWQMPNFSFCKTKNSLFALTDNLKNRIFQDKLGTIWDKSERIAKLAAFIATLIGADVEQTAPSNISERRRRPQARMPGVVRQRRRRHSRRRAEPSQPEGAGGDLRRHQPVQQQGSVKGPANYLSLLVNRARMEGFLW